MGHPGGAVSWGGVGGVEGVVRVGCCSPDLGEHIPMVMVWGPEVSSWPRLWG